MHRKVYKPMVRWAFSPTLNAWIVSAKGKAEVAVAFRVFGAPKRMSEVEIIERLFAWPTAIASLPFPRKEGVPSRLALQEVV
jgi:hypothetical protein